MKETKHIIKKETQKTEFERKKGRKKETNRETNK